MKAGKREPFPRGLVLGTAGFFIGIAVLALSLEETRDHAIGAARMVFSIFTTPFILETSIALIGLLTVVTLNQWRLMRDGEEWVDADTLETKKDKGEE
jgi:hypothetical protein